MKYFVPNYYEEKKCSLDLRTQVPFDGERSLEYLSGANNMIQALIDLGLIKVVYKND